MKKSGSNDFSFSSSAGNNNKVDRKTVEKNRRIHMKGLCFKLASLIPREEELLDHTTHSKDAISQHDHLDRAADYIKKLTARIEKLKQRKKYAAGKGRGDQFDGSAGTTNDEFGLPVIEVRYRDSILEVVLITGLKKKFMFYQLIQLLQEEGAEVVNASFSVVGEKIFHTIHSEAISPRIGIEASRVSDRLRDLIQ